MKIHIHNFFLWFLCFRNSATDGFFAPVVRSHLNCSRNFWKSYFIIDRPWWWYWWESEFERYFLTSREREKYSNYLHLKCAKMKSFFPIRLTFIILMDDKFTIKRQFPEIFLLMLVYSHFFVTERKATNLDFWSIRLYIVGWICIFCQISRLKFQLEEGKGSDLSNFCHINHE